MRGTRRVARQGLGYIKVVVRSLRLNPCLPIYVLEMEGAALSLSSSQKAVGVPLAALVLDFTL